MDYNIDKSKWIITKEQHIIILYCLSLVLSTYVLSLLNKVTLIGAILIVLTTFYLFLFIMQKKSRFLSRIMFLAFFLRFILSIINAFIWVLPSGRNDAIHFESSGWELASSSSSILEIMSTSAEFYRKFIGVLYYLVGRNPLLVQHISVITGTLLVYLIYRIVQQIFPSNGAPKTAAVIVTLYPGLIQFSVFTRRESLIYFFVALSFLFLLKWLRKGLTSTFIWASIFLVIAALFHSGSIFVGILYLLLYIFYKPKVKRWNISLLKILVSLLIISIVFVFGEMIFRKLPEMSIDGLAETAGRKAAGGRTGYLQNTQPDSLLDVLIQTPLRSIYFLFTPFPWQIRNTSDIYGFLLDTVPMYLLSFYMFKGFKILKGKNDIHFILLISFLILTITPFAWGTSNYGTAIRHRQKIVWIIISIGSIGYSTRNNLKNKYHKMSNLHYKDRN